MTHAISVLVIDDDPIGIAVATGHLAGAEIETRSASSVADAISMLETGPLPDVILSDVMMPQQDGFDLCAHVRATERLSHVPILFLTALGDRGARIRALDLGADDLLQKPVDDVELVARVRSLASLSRSRYLLQREARFDAVLAAVADGIVVTDGSGNVTEANVTARDLLALPDEVNLHEHLRHLGFEGDDPAPIEFSGLDAIVRRPGDGDRPEQAIRLKGTELFDPQGRPEGHVLVVRDVADEERAARAAHVVLSSIGHNFRTPLTGLAGVLKMLDRTEPTPPQEQLLRVMGNSLTRLESAIVRIVEYAQAVGVGEERALVELTPDTAQSIVRDLVPRHVGVMDRASITLPTAVTVPGAALAVIIGELVDNALRAATDEGHVELVLRGDANGLTVTVRDDGAGFRPQDAEHLFSAFFQTDKSGQEEGLGLGLSLVREVVGHVGGTVSGLVGDGHTTFTAWIPGR